MNDLDWHFVSLAYNLETKELRFGIDGLFETVPLDKPGFLLYLPVLNSGPLRVGAHQNASGTNNQFLRGSIDELRITRGWLPVDQLLDADWPDCNQNGMPDAMDLHAATSADCNSNFVPDECDVASGASADCQDDGIPDECQLAPRLTGGTTSDGRGGLGIPPPIPMGRTPAGCTHSPPRGKEPTSPTLTCR